MQANDTIGSVGVSEKEVWIMDIAVNVFPRICIDGHQIKLLHVFFQSFFVIYI
jgi:hypothetical protein